ncbi:MAG: hypothetical protein AAB268_04930 [Elusimicrobiota bacterium]
MDIGKPSDDDIYAAAGYERSLAINDDWQLTPRAGFNSRTLDDIGGFTGFTFTLDYAMLPLGGLGQSHRLSLNLSF